VGLAEDHSDAGPVHSAILSGFNDLFIVKEGDTVADRYRVTSIGSAGVELIEIGTNAPLRIPLK
jgi:hypothetical protein